MNEQRILVNSNSMAAGYAVDKATEAAIAVNQKLLPALKTIGIPLTQEVLKDLFSGTNKTEKNYFDALEKDLKNIKTPALYDSMKQTATIVWEQFETVLSTVRREAGNSYQYLTIVEGEAVLSSIDEERILEEYRIYLTEPKEVICFHQHEQIVKLLNEMFHDKAPYQWQTIFAIDASGKIFRNDSTNYSIIVSNAR